jgi:hypothetical protein
MSAGHTPGPWVVGPVDDTIVTHLGADGFRYEVAAVDGDYNQPDEWPVMEANARLIAAAPEMLQALEWIADNYENGHMNHVDFRVQAKHLADAAIAKATGATS